MGTPGGKDMKSRDRERSLGGAPGGDTELTLERVSLGRAQERVALRLIEGTYHLIKRGGGEILPGLGA